MKLKAIDQLHVSSVQPDSLRPGQEFEVSDLQGEQLLKAHPDKVELADATAQAKEPNAPADGAKAELAPLNKAEFAPANKVSHKRKGK